MKSKPFFKILISVLFFLLLTGCIELPFSDKKKTLTLSPDSKKEESSAERAQVQKTKVVLYYPDKAAQFLYKEEVEITTTPGIIKATLERLLEGPRSQELVNPFPSGIKLQSVDLKAGILEVNFDSSLKDLYPRGSSAESMFIFSIVNTVTDFPEVKKVKFLVDGKPESIVGSNYDFKTQDFARDESLIKK